MGTAHVSKRSVQDVEDTLRAQRPDRVLVELDPRRLEALQDPDAWRNTDLIQILREKKQHLFLLQLYLANMQARMGRAEGTAPGAEMLRAIQVAEEIGSEVVLIDRDVSITLKRGFGAMGFWQKIGLAMNVLMEMLPGSDEMPAPHDARRKAVGGAAAAVAVIAALALAPFGAWPMTAVGRVFDLLVGFPSVPLLSAGVFGFLAGLLVLSATPPRRGAGFWHWVQNVPVPVLLLGLLGSWAWGFSDGLSPSFLSSLVPFFSPFVSAVAGAVALGVGTWMGGSLIERLRSFERGRSAVAKQKALDVDALLERDAITQMTEEFARFAPVVKTALIDERDQYMASHVVEQARRGSLVAVVGAGHLPGMQKHLDDAGLLPRRELLDEPPKARLTLGKVLGYGLPLFILGSFVYLALQGRFADLKGVWVYWIVANGLLSAIGALLARGHILSVLTAFVAAPLTSLSPALAAGWFAGVVEAKMHTPTVADFEAIKGIESMKEFWKNGVVRVLLVTALANLGSVVGTWLGFAQILQTLGGP